MAGCPAAAAVANAAAAVAIASLASPVPMAAAAAAEFVEPAALWAAPRELCTASQRWSVLKEDFIINFIIFLFVKIIKFLWSDG